VRTKTPGERLRHTRIRLGLTTRDVDELSRKIATEKANEDFTVSHARLVQIENGESTPSIYKLYSLSAIYGCGVTDLLSLYLDLGDTVRQHLAFDHPSTHLIDFGAGESERKITFPVRFDPGFNLQKSSLLSRMVEVWGEVPVGLLQHLDLRRGRWGLIGLNDYTMYPLVRPGSLVQIDERQRPLTPAVHRSEYDRPIYFLELRDGYVCSWCEFRKGKIVSIPHPLSGVTTREFLLPTEAEVIGRVTAVAARFIPIESQEKPPAPSRKEPGQELSASADSSSL
jgi:transcriptional regulator with XRE-family HTH domain